MKIFEGYTSLTVDEVYLRLRNLTDPDSDNRRFKGYVEKSTFSVIRYTEFRSIEHRPRIDGSFTEQDGKTAVSVNIAMTKWNKRALSVYFALVCLLFLVLIIITPSRSVIDSFLVLILLLVWLLSVGAIVCLIYKHEEKRALKILDDELLIDWEKKTQPHNKGS